MWPPRGALRLLMSYETLTLVQPPAGVDWRENGPQLRPARCGNGHESERLRREIGWNRRLSGTSVLDRAPGERADMTAVSSGSVQQRPVPVTNRIRSTPSGAQTPSRIRRIVVHPARIGERPECVRQREAQGCRSGICDAGSDQNGREQLLNEEYQSIGQATEMVAAVSGMTGC